jgi:hypothetical protein
VGSLLDINRFGVERPMAYIRDDEGNELAYADGQFRIKTGKS